MGGRTAYAPDGSDCEGEGTLHFFFISLLGDGPAAMQKAGRGGAILQRTIT
jgi:hypothetical protein